MRPSGDPALQVSVSQLKSWLKCPRQYELKYVRGTEPAFVPVPLAFGSAIHKAFATFYTTIKATGSAPALERINQAFTEAWHHEVNGKVPLQEDEEDAVAEQLDKGISMLAVFHQAAVSAPLPDVDLVEHFFSVDIFDPDTGEALEEKLNGVVDLVVFEGACRVIVEHKSSARKYTQDQLRYDFQPTAYAFAAGQAGWGEVGLRYQVLTKTRTPTLQVASIRRDDQDTNDFLKTVVGVLRAIDAGAFWPQRGWQCRSCPYAHGCGSRP